jgi:large subunit ribosomal protein L18
MLSELNKRRNNRKSRALRNRKKLKGTPAKPRLSVCKTNKNIYLQLIDDSSGITLVSLSTLSKEISEKKSKDSAKILGTKIAELALQKQIEQVVFDRGRCKYHGIVAEIANSARSAGLKF